MQSYILTYSGPTIKRESLNLFFFPNTTADWKYLPKNVATTLILYSFHFRLSKNLPPPFFFSLSPFLHA